MPRMKIEEFTAKYDGPDVEDHTMDVTILGPALLAFGELHRAAYREMIPGDERIPHVKVQEVNPGSFEVILSIDLSWIDHAKSLLTKDNLAIAGGIVTITGFTLKDAVMGGIKAVRDKAVGKKKTRDELFDELGNIALARLVSDLQDEPRFISGCKGITRPLRDGRIDSLEVDGAGEEGKLSLDKDDAEAIEDLADYSEPVIRLEKLVVEVDTPHIRQTQKRKWRLYCEKYGTFTATMLDDDFAHAVHLGDINFRTGLKFMVKLRIEETEEKGSVKRSFEVIQMRRTGEDPGEQLEIL